MTEPTKQYLGDSVYADVENGMIKLTTENGLPNDPSNVIFIEPFVMDALYRYAVANNFLKGRNE